MSRPHSPMWTQMSDTSSACSWEIDEVNEGFVKDAPSINYSMVFYTENGSYSEASSATKKVNRADTIDKKNVKRIKKSVESLDCEYPFAHPSKLPIAFEEIVTTFNAIYCQFFGPKVAPNGRPPEDKKFAGKIYFDGLSEAFLQQHRDDGFLCVDSPGNDTDWKLLIFIDALISFMLHRDCGTNKKYQQKQNLISAVRFVMHEIHGLDIDDVGATNNLVSFKSVNDKHFADTASLRRYLNIIFIHRIGKSKGKFIAIAEDFLNTLEKRESRGPLLHVVLNNIIFQICDTHSDISLPCASGRIFSPYIYNIPTRPQTVADPIEAICGPSNHLNNSSSSSNSNDSAPTNKFNEVLMCIKMRFELINTRLDRLKDTSASVTTASQISKFKPQKGIKYIRKQLQSGEWCSPGSIVGIYADGIGLPTIYAESFGVVEMIKSPDTIVREWSPVTSIPSIGVPAELENAILQSKSLNIMFEGSTHVKLVDNAIIKHMYATTSVEILCIDHTGDIFMWDKLQDNVRLIGLIWVSSPLSECPSELVANFTLISNHGDESAIINDVMNHVKETEEKLHRIEKLENIPIV